MTRYTDHHAPDHIPCTDCGGNAPSPRRFRRDEVERFAAQLGLDADALDRAATAVWSNLNPQSVSFERALSVAGVALQAARATL